jgi:hypothetical protein
MKKIAHKGNRMSKFDQKIIQPDRTEIKGRGVNRILKREPNPHAVEILQATALTPESLILVPQEQMYIGKKHVRVGKGPWMDVDRVYVKPDLHIYYGQEQLQSPHALLYFTVATESEKVTLLVHVPPSNEFIEADPENLSAEFIHKVKLDAIAQIQAMSPTR